MTPTTAEQPLTGLRILDLADESAALCGRILADLGAEVVLVEPPGGNRIRRRAPFLDERPGLERSYLHLYYNANKRSLCLDLEDRRDRRDFEALVTGADALIDTAAPGALDRLGLSHAQLRALNPSLIQTSVTPFGQTGRWRDRRGSDLVGSAAAGMLAICGERQDPPMQGPARPSHTIAALWAASATVFALHGQDRSDARSGGGHIDVSQQEATTWMLLQTSNPNTWTQFHQIPLRPALSQAMRCADGKWVSLDVNPMQILSFIAELNTAGVPHDFTEQSWELFRAKPCAWQILENPLQQKAIDLAATMPRDELLRRMRGGGHLGMPVLDFAEMRELEHFRQRKQFRPILHAALEAELSFVRSPVDGVTVGAAIRPAPSLGEANSELLGAGRTARPVAPPRRDSTISQMPLAGLRVLDFCWVLAGPLGGRLLANFGADVIRIESGGARMDAVRNQHTTLPEPNPDLGELLNAANTGKRSLTLDLRTEGARRVVRELAAQVDVMVDNFRDGALARMGFPYEDLHAINPRLIVLHLPGTTGDTPWGGLPSFGNQTMAAAGHNFLTGSPGRPPRGVGFAYPDFTSPHLLALSVVAALRHRDRTGEGREITLEQLSATVSVIGADWMRFGRDGMQPPRPSNRDPNFCPHGAYATAGDTIPDGEGSSAGLPYDGEREADRWIAIAVDGDEAAQWQGFVRTVAATGGPDLGNDPRFLDHAARKLHEDVLEELIAAWTEDKDRWQLATRLQEAGVPAAAVEDLRDTLELDPILSERHYQTVRQPSNSEYAIVVDRDAVRFDGQARELVRAPMLGEHSAEILRDLLGYSEDDIGQLVAEGVIG